MDRDPALRSTSALLNRIDKLSSDLLQRYIDIVVLSKPPNVPPPEDAPDQGGEKREQLDRNMTGVNMFKMDVETAALVRAAESVLTLTRSMKELWLFGQLDTLGKSAALEQTEADARAVAALVEDALGIRKLASAASASQEQQGERMDVDDSVADA